MSLKAAVQGRQAIIKITLGNEGIRLQIHGPISQMELLWACEQIKLQVLGVNQSGRKQNGGVEFDPRRIT